MNTTIKTKFVLIILLCISVSCSLIAGNAIFNVRNLLNNMKKNSTNEEEFDDIYNSVNVVVLKKVKPQPTFFYGDVEPLRTLNVSFNYPGKIDSIKRVGACVASEVKGHNGKIIRPATVIASYNEKQMKQVLLQAKLEKKMAEEDLKFVTRDVEMMDKLSKSHAVSTRSYNASKTSFNKAILSLKSAEIDYNEALDKYSNRLLKAPFTGIVEDSYVTPGEYVSAFQPVARIVKIDTMVVKLQLMSALKKILKKNSYFLIYPEGKSNPVKGWMINNHKNNNLIDVYVKNSLEHENMYPFSSTEKKIYQVFPVTNAYSNVFSQNSIENNGSIYNKIPIAVPVNAVKHDKKGDYIFIVDKGMELNNAYQIDSNQILHVKKIYIKLSDIHRKYIMTDNASIDLCSIEPNKNIQKDDIVVLSAEPDLQDGDKALFVEKKWNFYPDQKVKVRIPMLSRPGFYVPPEAIISLDQNENYIYKINHNSTVVLEKVIIDGYAKGFYSIVGKSLKTGDQIVIVDDVNLYQKLFDGAEVFIKKIYDPSGYLQRKSVMRKYELKTERPIEENTNVFMKKV